MIRELISYTLRTNTLTSGITDCGTQCRNIVLSINILIDRMNDLIDDNEFKEIIIKIKEIIIKIKEIFVNRTLLIAN